MSWTSFWKVRTIEALERRKREYALDAPPRVAAALAKDRIGVRDAVRLLFYIIFGSPRQWSQLFITFLADRDTPKKRKRIESLAQDLRSRLSEESRVIPGYFERRLYSRDLARVPRALEKTLHRTTPLLVAQPATERDVEAILAFASGYKLPIFPRGVSSSAFGGAVPTRNGIVIDLSAMRRILAIDADARTVRLQPGVRWADLASALEPFGLVPITTPSSRFSTVGGWASTGGLGIDGFGHGPFSDALLSTRIAFPDGAALSIDGPALKDFVGMEGQLGIFTELSIRVRQRPSFSSSRLLAFEGVEEAFRFIEGLVASGVRPSHVAFFDRERLHEENKVFRDRFGRPEVLIEEKDSVLFHFESREDERAFLDFHAKEGLGLPGSPESAACLWAGRFFPLHAQRIGPSMLASEVVLPRRAVPVFVRRARRIARRFGRPLAVEVFVSRTATRQDCVAIVSFLCDARQRLRYLFDLLLVQLLTHLGIDLDGCPYGFGIWNSPFLSRRYSRDERKALIRRKLKNDPFLLLNPMKFFRIRTRLFNLPGLFFIGPVFFAGLGLARLLSPVLGLAARAVSGREEPPPISLPGPGEDGRPLLRQAASRCAFCGACVSSCPAYLITRDELVTGRAKLRLAEALLSGEEVQERESAAPFLCLRCGLCEEVCQTRLPLRDCYLVLEGLLETRHRKPVERITAFIRDLEKNRDWIRSAFGLDLPDWRPEQ